MIDKIEVRLPRFVDFTPWVEALVRQPGLARPGLHYTGVLDLRPYDIDAMLHYGKKRGEQTHKLEVFDSGDKVYSEIDALMSQVVRADISQLELMRLDLCADIRDVPVSWFHAHTRIRYKQLGRHIGPLKADVISRGSIETVSTGCRPNMIRFYNKLAEWMMQLRRANRRLPKGSTPLDFETVYGISPEAILTRVERQYGGGRLPRELKTFGQLHRAATINPFGPLELIMGSSIPPRVEDYELGEWLKGMQLRNIVKDMGMHAARRWLNKHSPGNASRWLRDYAAFMPGDEGIRISTDDLTAIYQESTRKQLAA